VRHALALGALALALVPSGAAADQAATGRATLRVLPGSSLVLRGTSFVPGERVRISVAVGRSLSKRTIADSSGAFTVGFRASYDRCASSLTALAVGDRGSRARVKRPDLMCPPRL